MKKILLWMLVVSMVVVFSMVGSLVGCKPAVEEEAVAPAEEEAAVVEPVAAPAEKIQVRWFVGLGAGSDAGTFDGQKAVVDEYNASQDKYELILEIVDNDVAYDTLAIQISAYNAPDIVGPVGIRGRDSFYGAWLDLQPYIDKNNYDLSVYDPALVKFYEVKEEGQLGIPFGIFPSFIVYNLDLFDEAGLNYPPAQYGEKYVMPDGTEVEWNMDTLREVGMLLTVDANGNDATSPDFNSKKIVQFGFLNQFTDPRGIGTFFGAGSLVADDGVTAQIPETWQAAWKWNYAGMWTDWFIPNGAYQLADFMQGGGGPFSSGNLAMIHIHTWFVAPWGLADVANWNLAATPSYNGVVTSKMHADTFCIPEISKNPDAAFEVLTYMLSEEVATKLVTIYGGMPARLSLQDTYFDTYTETNFPDKEDINWDVVVASMAYPDNPNHESWMPSFQETTDKYNEFYNKWANTPGLDIDAEIAALTVSLQTIFTAAQ
ncbi:MAG: extracellular solute-binding protein [Candidatus Hydromicrobium sp.]